MSTQEERAIIKQISGSKPPAAEHPNARFDT
jgi:hypothetical protein